MLVDIRTVVQKFDEFVRAISISTLCKETVVEIRSRLKLPIIMTLNPSCSALIIESIVYWASLRPPMRLCDDSKSFL